MCSKFSSKISVIADSKTPSGILGQELKQAKFSQLINILEKIKTIFEFDIIKTSYGRKNIKEINTKYLGRAFRETHCFRGYPIFGCSKQFEDSEAEYILHLDCDMIFYEKSHFSWIEGGINIMENNQDILCVLPRGGPPSKDTSLHQNNTEYIIDKKRNIYLFKNFTSRHYLINRERFLSVLPLKPLWLSWREPIKSRLFGNGKMLCWETMVENALEKSHMWRADLMTDEAWSLHPGERTNEFYNLLPKIIECVNNNEFPEEQRGHFDLRLNNWVSFLN